MTIILKKSKNNEKGIILVSHRELLLYKFFKYYKGAGYIELKENYYLLLHVGAYFRKFKVPGWVDFVYTTPSNVGLGRVELSKKFINVCSRDVLPKQFNNKESDREIDCIYIANNSKNKRAREFFELVESAPELKFMLVLSYGLGTDRNKFDLQLVDDILAYQKKLGPKTNLVFIDAKHKPDGTYSINRTDISNYLSMSKVYIHFCRREGESRSIGEALSAGCYVYKHEELIGGANDILHDKNSDSFIDIHELGYKVTKLLSEGFEHSDISDHYNMVRRKALKLLASNFKSLGMKNYDIEKLVSESDLSMLLPGHIRPNFISKGVNADIVSKDDFLNFLNEAGINYRYFSIHILWTSIKIVQFFKRLLFKVRYRVKI
ncbi:MAG TPA: hypothetical protein DEF74_03625 [Pseudoalteromonas sp.]|nr:hypothetical protein [Pseudoalteromonas sp.]|tara:strand:- start:9159 stop:10289 length:1131 start_codon:yes stop_codon:yes gene_type:complete